MIKASEERFLKTVRFSVPIRKLLLLLLAFWRDPDRVIFSMERPFSLQLKLIKRLQIEI
jgi:hypothetical protein